ncbi:AMP-binding protein [Cryobacterium arcticum]|uniref:Putative fatty-acid--CoA ligase n=1 Tax=Cryobacterium arcticum TaxID=670052 RepID=A0A1B1BKM3_9MICO|nr:AMP-binding protein [Cryobacterium arcticum]ANP73172.1 Putative fatty-acid--CoA ligase [Cryobacterium arcticum]
MSRVSFAQVFADLAQVSPDRVLVTADEGTLTAGQLHRGSNRWARDLAAHGVGRNDLVSVALPNGLLFIEVCVAIWKLGATPQPLSPKLPAETRSAIIEVAGSVLLVDADYRPDLSFGDDDLPDAWADSWKAPTSSGSTGTPKIVRAAAPALIDPSQPVAAFIPQQAVQLVSGPLFHSATFTYAFRGLMTGHTLVVLPRFDERRVLEAITEHRVSWLLLVPTMMHRIRRLPAVDRDRADLRSIETLLHLGAPCAPDLKRFFCDWLGAERIIEVYAGTESSGLTMIRGDEWLDHPGSVGRPIGGSRFEVRDVDGAPCPPDVVGEVWMTRSGGPSYQYLGAPDRRVDGWDSLGDLGYLDADGYLYVLDRRDDLIITGGENVYPAEVERVLEQHPLVRSAVAYGVPDDDLGQRVEAVVDIGGATFSTAHDASTGTEQLASEMLGWCRERLEPTKRPRAIRVATEPLRNDAGKANRSTFGP